MSSSDNMHDRKKKGDIHNDKWEEFQRKSPHLAEESDHGPSEVITTQSPGEGENTLTDVPGISKTSSEELENQLNAAEAKNDELRQQLLRNQADLENLRRRSEREVSQAHKFALESFTRELLSVIDNLERSLDQKNNASDIAALYTGVELTLKLLQSTMEKFQVKVIAPTPGTAFDPNLHEAMSMQEHSEFPPGSVVAVLQKGYQLHERLLRPTLVVVSKAADSP